MRQCLAVVVALVGGCSFIYNPDHISRDIDAAVDVIADVDPTMLHVDDVYPHVVYEGAGTGHAAPAVFVISGSQIAADATVTITPAAMDASSVHVLQSKASINGNFIAFTLQVDDNATKDDGMERGVTLTVSQLGGTITQALPATKLVVHHLDSLTAATVPPLRAQYSLVDITGAVSFPATNDVGAISIRAVGLISITGKVSADASGQTAGQGGCSGGASQASGESSNGMTGWSCSGHGISAGGGLLNNVGGGGAGFASPGTSGAEPAAPGGNPYGTREIDAFANNCPSGGGGGGAATLGSATAAGGGGGILELTAGGDVTLGAGASANGGNGVNGGGGDGGGGAGGVVLVRAGATLAITGSVTVTKGTGGINGVAGGDGSIGRIRADAAKGTFPPGSYNAPVFVDPPATSADATTMVTVRGFAGDQTATLTVYDAQGMVVGTPVPIAFGASDMLMQPVTLGYGYNRICAIVKNGNLSTNPEAGNCSEIAFLP